MEEMIRQTLAAMTGLEDRAILKDVLSDVFLPLYAETQMKYAALEQRIRDELPLITAPFSVYCTVLPRTQVESGHSYLSPMAHEEVGGREVALGETMGTFFYEADYLQCRRLAQGGQFFEGVMTVKGEVYPFKFRLEPAGRYMKLVEALHGIFMRNGVPWTTVNCAYLCKFFDAVIVELPGEFPSNLQILPQQIQYILPQLEGTLHRDMVPLWNMDRHPVKGDDFPVPAGDKINYEYRFDVTRLGVDNGFLVDYDSAYIQSVRREGSSIVAVSPVPKGLTWDIYRFRRQRNRVVDAYTYPVLSNAAGDSFSARLTAGHGVSIGTKAELRKALNALDATQYMTLESMDFTETPYPNECYDMNPFIKDELRDPRYMRTLILAFKGKNSEFFLNRDLMSFLVSQAQALYPQWNCVGTLL